MLFKKQGMPEVGDTVICTVKKILYHSVFVVIDEYKNIEGMVHISEIAPGRIRNLRDYVIEGKKIVCKVLSINNAGNIDLSLRRVPKTLTIAKLNSYKQEEKAEKLLEQVGKDSLGINLEKVYEEIGNKAIKNYGGLFPFLQAIVENGRGVIDEFNPNPKFAEKLFETVKEKIKPIEVSVSGILNLKSVNGDGVEQVKNILSNGSEHNVKISYLGAPKYKLEVISKDYKTAESSLKGFLDNANTMAKKFGCNIEFIKND